MTEAMTADYLERVQRIADAGESPATWAELRDARFMVLGTTCTTPAEIARCRAELARLDGIAADWRERDEREAVARVVEAVRSGACRTRGGWA
jgi:hypothetical protein